eukprot:GEMP01049077.1.p1 GENE.GEMP01049077.1~~GEMP01049077.1.p1  ORF type:complete len:181 (+),score=25.18 GEMP01049077.1:149-691(+)
MFIGTLMTVAVGSSKASQIHLAIGGEGSRDMIVTFRIDGVAEAQVCWGENDLLHLASVRRNCSYWEGNYMSALLSPLKPKTKYLYAIVEGLGPSCANRVNLSGERHFFAPPTQTDAVNMLIYGDMGLGEVGHSVESRMLLEDLKTEADAVIHAGDISYADDSFLRPESFFKFTYEKIYNG